MENRIRSRFVHGAEARKKSRHEIRKLLGPYRQNIFALNLDLDTQRRTKIRSLHDGAAHPHIPWKIGRLERVEDRSAAGVSDHGMFRAAKAVLVFQLIQIRDVLELAIAVGRVQGKRPVAARLGNRARRQTNEQGRDVFARLAVANIKLFGGPGLGHLRYAGNPWRGFGGMRKQGTWIGRGSGNFDLRLLFGLRRSHMFRPKGPASGQKNDEQDGEETNDQPNRRIHGCAMRA